MTKYEKLFFKIRTFSHKKSPSPGVILCYDNKNSKMPRLIHYETANGEDFERLYGSNGKPVLWVKLKNGKPHGRAKMYNEEGLHIYLEAKTRPAHWKRVPNTYWYEGMEIEGEGLLNNFKFFEEEENQIITKIKQRDNNAIIPEEELDKIYETDSFQNILEICASLMPNPGNRLPNLRKQHLTHGR